MTPRRRRFWWVLIGLHGLMSSGLLMYGLINGLWGFDLAGAGGLAVVAFEAFVLDQVR